MGAPMLQPLEHWRRRTHQYIEGLLQRVDELSVLDYPATAPHQVIDFLRDILAVIATEVVKAGSEDKLRNLGQLVQHLGIFLEWLDNAHTGQTPRGLVQLLKRLMDRLTPGGRVVAWPQPQYNYSIFDLGDHLRGIVNQYVPHSKQAGFDKHLNAPIKLISFPRIERDNMLTHAVFGHELGHPIATEFLEHELNTPAYAQAQTDIQKSVDSYVGSLPIAATLSQAERLDKVTNLVGMVLNIRKRAVEELVSDAVGILLFGPSAFFALYEVLWIGNWDSLPRGEALYPPSRMRIRRSLALLEDLGWPAALDNLKDDPIAGPYVTSAKAFLDEGRGLVQQATDEAAIDSKPIVKIAYDWMRSSIDDAVAFSKKRTAGVAFEAQLKISDLPGLLERLQLGVPPNELGDPANSSTVDHRSALLAAWLFKLQGVDSQADGAGNSAVDRLNQSTMRAVEYITLQDDYRQEMLKVGQ